MDRGGECQYDVLLKEQGIEIHATYCPFIDGLWCIHLTIIDFRGGGKWNFGWIRNRQGYRVWRGLDNNNPGWVNNLFEIYAWWLLGNDFSCKKSIYDF